MARVENWVLKVRDQKKLDSGNIRMNCQMNGSKHDDGTYDTAMFITVILTDKTEWAERCDETGNYIDVSGNFTHGDWKKDDKTGKNFTIFASKVSKHKFDDEKKPNNKSNNY